MTTEPSSLSLPDAAVAFVQLMKRARESRHRALVVLSGSQQWGWNVVDMLTAGCESVSRVGARMPNAIPAGKARQLLGSECVLAVFDAHDGLHPDALAAVCGSVIAGGALILLTPPMDDWSQFADPDYERLASYPHDWRHLSHRFIEHIQHSICEAGREYGCLQINESINAHWQSAMDIQWPTLSSPSVEVQPSPAQQLCLSALSSMEHVAVLMAGRGRGKSALLGFAAHEWQAQGKQVLLVAPSKSAATSVFRHAGDWVSFSAPDALLQDETVTADLLLIDEAAAIPLPMLLPLLTRFPKVVLATTTDGYEGTGQGFLLRFLRELDTFSPSWLRLTLDEPVRWAANDPLESWLYNGLLLDTKEAGLQGEIDQAATIFERFSQQDFLADPDLLGDVYGLLRSAHYRTTPDDLRFLLDAPALSLYRLQSENQTIAVAMVVEEGSIDCAMAEEITAGRRRPRGHLLVQTLAVQNSQPQYLCERVARVVRIAVHTQCQQRGLGSSLLQQLIQDQKQCGVSVMGSSFSATPEVLSFWQKNGFELLRIGHRRQAASAAPSALVLRK